MRTGFRALRGMMLKSWIEYAKANYRVDVSRIYMTGISLGAGCVWDYAVENVAYAKKAEQR